MRSCLATSRCVSHPAMQMFCSYSRQWREWTDEAEPGLTSLGIEQMEKQANDELRKVADMARLGYVLARQVPQGQMKLR